MNKISEQVRKFSWRLGRRLYCWARGDLHNNPETNGEYWLLQQFLQRSGGGVLFDVGANKGNWSQRALELAAKHGQHPRLFAFEPCESTREILRASLGSNSNVTILPYALSSADGEALFYSNAPGSGTNSLDSSSGATAERVQLTTVDAVLQAQGIERLAMLKIDTEGFDLAVLQGAAGALSKGNIDLVQFEYNWRWLINNACLRDVFALIQDKPYRLGKLAGERIILFDQWHFEMDRFFENNYVLVRKGSEIERISSVGKFDPSNVALYATDASSKTYPTR